MFGPTPSDCLNGSPQRSNTISAFLPSFRNLAADAIHTSSIRPSHTVRSSQASYCLLRSGRKLPTASCLVVLLLPRSVVRQCKLLIPSSALVLCRPCQYIQSTPGPVQRHSHVACGRSDSDVIKMPTGIFTAYAAITFWKRSLFNVECAPLRADVIVLSSRQRSLPPLQLVSRQIVDDQHVALSFRMKPRRRHGYRRQMVS